MTRTKNPEQFTANAAKGIIRSGPIPNPGRMVPESRKENPSEILGIFVNPREDKPKKKRGKKAMAKKKSKKKTGRKKSSRSSARRSGKKKLSKAEVRKVLRHLMARNPNPAALALPGAAAGKARGSGIRASLGGAAELRRNAFLETAQTINDIDTQIAANVAKLQETKDEGEKAIYAGIIADLQAQKDRMMGSMGSIDTLLFSDDDFVKKAQKKQAERRQKAITRALTKAEIKGLSAVKKKGMAGIALAIAASGMPQQDTVNKILSAGISDTITPYNPLSGSRVGSASLPFLSLANRVAGGNLEGLDVGSYKTKKGQTILLATPREALAKAIQMLEKAFALGIVSDSSINSSAGLMRANALMEIIKQRLQAAMGGRIDNPSHYPKLRESNPRGGKRKGKKRKSSKRKSGKKKKRGKKRGKRKKNPGLTGLTLFSGNIMDNPMNYAKGGLAIAVGFAAAHGLSMASKNWFADKIGFAKSDAKLKALVNTSAIAFLGSAGAFMAGKQIRVSAPLIMGMAIPVGIRAVDYLIGPSDNKFVKAFRRGLGLSLSGFGTYSPDMDGYYNFEPVMSGYYNYAPTMGGMPDMGYQVSGMPDVGYQVSGMPDVGYQVSGMPDMGYQVSGMPDVGYQVSGVPDVSGNPFGKPF